jgi:decaprenylphospho-beta-D-erythro-pentofuranosid-2-ulose 2-reductase
VRDGLGRYESVLILGGGSEIALATVRALVARGTRRVVLAARRPDELAGVAAELGAEVALEAWDADDPAGHDAWVDDVWARHGDLDLVLHAAGVLGDPARDHHEGGAARAVVATNFAGAVGVLVPVAERLRAQGHGALVVLSSVAGERARRANFVYGASKAGLDAFAQGLGDELAPAGVRVLVVRPGFVRTKMTAHLDGAPLSADAEQVAEATVRGLDRGADVVWVPAALRWVMAVVRHLPRRLFRRLPF